MDLEGLEVVLRLVGPIRAERRDVSWPLPRLLPTEAATHTLKLIPSGYGLMQVWGDWVACWWGTAVCEHLHIRGAGNRWPAAGNVLLWVWTCACQEPVCKLMMA